MNSTDKDPPLRFYALIGGVFVASVLAYASWDQALHFDPCDNIFKPPSRACETSPWGYGGAGAFTAFIGVQVLYWTVVKGPRALGSRAQAVMAGWIALCVAVLGAACLFIAYNLAIAPPEAAPVERVSWLAPGQQLF
ncbi:MAG: hypothetical protein AAFN04_15820 [Pseudomonadota bacterium]